MADELIGRLVSRYNLQNVQTLAVLPNNYSALINKTTEQDKELYKSELGTPVFTDLTFDRASYDDDTRRYNVPPITLVTVLMAVDQPKNIVATQIAGRDGTIKEYIGKGDYQITINGIITGANGHYPSDKVRALKSMLDVPKPLSVTSRYLNDLDVFNIVVVDYHFAQEMGGYSQQIFTINAISNLPTDIIIGV